MVSYFYFKIILNIFSCVYIKNYFIFKFDFGWPTFLSILLCQHPGTIIKKTKTFFFPIMFFLLISFLNVDLDISWSIMWFKLIGFWKTRSIGTNSHFMALHWAHPAMVQTWASCKHWAYNWGKKISSNWMNLTLNFAIKNCE